MIKAINQSMTARREGNEKGFTLIELLVVILIIGVLAAIAIPAFLNQRQSAWVSQAESDLRNAAIAAESFAVANNGSYAPSGTLFTIPDLEAQGFNSTAAVVTTIDAASTGTAFVLIANHNDLDENYKYSSATGIITEE